MVIYTVECLLILQLKMIRQSQQEQQQIYASKNAQYNEEVSWGKILCNNRWRLCLLLILICFTYYLFSSEKQANNFPQENPDRVEEIFERHSKFRTFLIRQQAGISLQSSNRGIDYIMLGIKSPTQQMIKNEKQQLEKKYHMSSYKQQLPMCVVIPSYKNVIYNRYIFNLKSILDQDYKNFHIVYIDDNSPDNTASHVEKFMVERNVSKEKYVIIKNEEKRGALYNERLAAQKYCKPHQIYVLVDGDDGLVGTQVFKLFNTIYQQRGSLFVYGNHMNTNTGVVGISRKVDPQIFNKALYRSSTSKKIWPISHLKTFYTQLFLRVPETDLMYPNSNKYFETDSDRAIVYPIIEMIRDNTKIQYIPEIVYLYNYLTQLADYQTHYEQMYQDLYLIQSIGIKQKIQCLFKKQTGECYANPSQYSLKQSLVQNKQKK